MDVVPIEVRIAGVDGVVCGEVAAGRVELTDAELAEIRVAAAEFITRHDELMRRLDAGEEPRWAVCDGVVAFWPDDLHVVGGLPEGGSEVLPVAAAVLGATGEREVLVAAASKLAAALRARAERDLDIAGAVARELAEALVFCGLVADLLP